MKIAAIFKKIKFYPVKLVEIPMPNFYAFLDRKCRYSFSRLNFWIKLSLIKLLYIFLSERDDNLLINLVLLEHYSLFVVENSYPFANITRI